MEVTTYLKNKLVALNDTFTHRNEQFKMVSYGGTGHHSFAYWKSDKGTTIEMHYSMKQIGADSFKGVNEVKSIEIY